MSINQADEHFVFDICKVNHNDVVINKFMLIFMSKNFIFLFHCIACKYHHDYYGKIGHYASIAKLTLLS